MFSHSLEAFVLTQISHIKNKSIKYFYSYSNIPLLISFTYFCLRALGEISINRLSASFAQNISCAEWPNVPGVEALFTHVCSLFHSVELGRYATAYRMKSINGLKERKSRKVYCVCISADPKITFLKQSRAANVKRSFHVQKINFERHRFSVCPF